MTEEDNMTRHDMISKLSTGLGALVWYDLSGTRITPDRMRAILASEGDDPSVVPDIDPEAAVKRAIRSWTEGRGEFKSVIGSDTDAEIVVNILRKQRTGAKKVEMLLHDSVVFSKASASFSAPSSKEAASFVRLAEQTIECLDHSWIRPRLIHARLADMSAFVLRRQGGVYFVPSQFREDLDKLARIVSQIGDSMLSIAHVEATDASQASIGGAARGSIAEGLGEVVEKLSAWKESARKTSGAALSNALADLADLRARADLYSDALSIALDDLSAEIDGAVDLAREIVEEQESGVVKASPVVVAALVALVAETEPTESGTFEISSSRMKEAGLAQQYSYWKGGVGAESAASIGFVSKISEKAGQERKLVLSPVSGGDDDGAKGSDEPEAVEEPVAEEPVDAEDRQGDAREKLAQKTRAEVAALFEVFSGKAPLADATKSEIIEGLLAAIG
jgi:hypothetical protein